MVAASERVQDRPRWSRNLLQLVAARPSRRTAPSGAGSAAIAQLANFMRRMVLPGAEIFPTGDQGAWLCLGGRAPNRGHGPHRLA